jgi:hypothetical protein
MLLAELGFLDTFMGGGFQAMIGEAGRMVPVIVHYSDVPEWAALIANIRQWWRSYPWMALYPGLAFFLSILAFNLFGEGLRRFLDESQMNLSRLFNKYTLTAMTGGIIILGLTLQSASPLGIYREEGSKFNPENVIRDIATLSQRDFQGRETGTAGADAAAEYIAERMEASGLLPAGEHGTYFLSNASPRPHLTQMPIMELLDPTGEPTTTFTYRKDFAELAIPSASGEVQKPVRGLVFGAEVGETTGADPYGLRNTDAVGHTVIVRGEDLPRVNRGAVDGVLVIADQTYNIERKDLFPSAPFISRIKDFPILVISPEVAEMLLSTAGSSLEELEQMSSIAPAGGVLMTEPGAVVRMSVLPERVEDLTSEKYVHVVGVLPGEGSTEGLDNQVIMVGAYYDGLGTGSDGSIYPGANDNASGVATLFELARLLKETPYKPDKTVLFVAWAGGERWEGLSVVNIMNARPGGLDLAVTEVIELSGVGYGSGDAIALGEESSYRLVQLFQSAAKRYDITTTTRGRNPHYGREGAPGFGDRKALTLTISWDGADEFAHTPRDLVGIIDPEKLSKIGRTTLLSLLVLARESDY